MNDSPETASLALLPAGLRDVLPADAAFESDVGRQLLAIFARHGYEQVAPPLVEFEDSFLSGPGAAMARDSFRLMDPVSQRMMVVRSDITPQVARIATTRLAGAPRPLRLAYLGQVLLARGRQLRPQRQFRQAGIELIGSTAPEADAEAIVLAVTALSALGLRDITVDLNVPTLIPSLCADLGYAGGALTRLKAALDRKDAAAVARLAEKGRETLLALLDAAAPAEEALARLEHIALPADAAAARAELAAIVPCIRAELPDLTLTVDAVEHRGFEYHSGTSYTIFGRGLRGELGRGGRYMAGHGSDGEPAVGMTLFMDAVQRAVRQPPAPPRVFLAYGTPPEERRRLQADGWITVAGLEPADDTRAEAQRMACTHALIDGVVEQLEDRG
ncbi:ATP phosphoribosyltransferase regulatory subunit [Constrictibacter sp. MBR-5]|jgi:ATP phosphoribosyltransferase regulatory subunit|uniref:ATP phosphoribosyltransferase regulatory subunit n=1 Tax=Constrictibacter sp. MBR-5 TaxID=3156467 RepID=UPI003395DBAC